MNVRGVPRALAAVIVAAGLVLAACAPGGSDPGDIPEGPGKAGELRILAGSELSDLQPILEEAKEKTGVAVHFEFVGTLDGVQRVLDGQTKDRFDAVWFPSNRYLSLHPEAAGKTKTETKIMTSPVVLGLASSKASSLGWGPGSKVTWSDIAKAAGEQKFTYGMTNPAASNSGFSALVGVAAALSGTGAALEQADIDKVGPGLQKFFSAQKLTAGSSGWLADEFAARASSAKPGVKVDGVINYESVLLTLNAAKKVPEPLTLIYPTDGVVTADYPLTLLSTASDEVADGYRKLADYLRTPDVQREIMSQTHRRPAIPQVKPTAEFGAATLVELPFPAKVDVVNGLIDTYFDKLRRPARTVYVLDVSGSMDGERIEALRNALVTLTGASDTIAGRFQRFHSREEITLLPFDSGPHTPQVFVVPEKKPEQVLGQIKSAAEALEPGGDTAVFDSVLAAFDELGKAPAGDFATSVVVMTDGESNHGADSSEFWTRHAQLSPALRNVPIFTVLFGEGNTDEMKELAARTGGRAFDAREGSLEAAFREIRGYQ